MKLFSFAARSLVAFALVLAPAALTGCAVSSEDAVQSDDADLKQKAGHFEMFQGQDGQFYFHLLAGNGEKVLASEGYGSWSAAAKGIKAVQHELTFGHFDILYAVDGRVYFNLVATNGQVVATSQLYTSLSTAKIALETVKQIIDKTIELGNAPTGAPTVVVFKGLDSRFYFHVRAKNGEIVLHSQGYSTKAGAQKGASSVLSNGKSAASFQLREAQDGQFYFVLRATNKQIIGVSELYASKYSAERGIDGVVKVLGAADATIQ